MFKKEDMTFLDQPATLASEEVTFVGHPASSWKGHLRLSIVRGVREAIWFALSPPPSR